MADVRRGAVVSVENGLIGIVYQTPEECGKCGACAAFSGDCASGVFFTRNVCAASVGDTVLVETDGSVFLKSCFLLYFLPCVCFIAGLFAGGFFLPEPLCFCLGAAFMAACVLFSKRFLNGAARRLTRVWLEKS